MRDFNHRNTILPFILFLALLATKINAQNPSISAFTPTSGGPSTSIIISGSNFANVSAVNFGGVGAASFTVISSTAIVATVGSGATGSISVTTSTGSGSISGFTFIAPTLTISSFSPTSGKIGTTVTIVGTNFSTTPANNTVYFGAVKATVTNSTATSLTVTVPYGATYQPITVTTNNLTAFSLSSFVVTFSGGGSALTSSSFQATQDFATGTSPINPTVSDLDGDGKPDLLVVNENSNSVSVFRNTSANIGSISFASKLDIAVNAYPTGMATADFDGDGKPDLVVAGVTNTSLGVYRNTSSVGNISFASTTNYTTGSGPSFIVTGDIDGDGKPDIIIANSGSNTVSVFLNTSTAGNITFASKQDFSTGSYPWRVAIGDIDGDGKIDIITGNQSSNTISVLLNKSSVGNIFFASKVDFIAASGPRGIVVGDIDGDGKLDVVVGNVFSNSISVFRNTSGVGSVSFASRVDASAVSGSYTIDVSLADIDGDGKVDILAADATTANQASVFKNNSTTGSISLNTTVNYGAGLNPGSLTNADLDADGKPDIILANLNAGTISVLRNQIGSPVITSFTPTSVAAGTSVIISGFNFTNVTAVSFGGVAATSFTVVSSSAIIATVGSGASGSISVTTSAGTGTLAGFTFLVPIPTISSFSPTSGIIGTTVTITGTNFSAIPANNIVYFGAVKATVSAASTTSLTVTVPYGATYQPITITTNNLITASAKPFIVTFSGGGNAFTANTLSTRTDYTGNSTNNVAGLSDLDGDGKPDIISVNEGSNTLSFFRNTSTGARNISFATKLDINTSTFPLGGIFTDFDGDGMPDIAFTCHSINTIGVIRNTSTGIGNIAFSSEVNYATGSSPYYIAVGDLDGDGKPDLAVCNSSNNTVSVYLNKSTVGTLAFAPQTTFTVGQGPKGIAIGDIDGDGKPDIVTANGSANTVSILRNTSTGIGNITFIKSSDYSTGTSPYSLSLGDLDGDGKLDIAACNTIGASVSLLRNTSTNGSVSFATTLNYSTGIGSSATYLCLTDIDGDGKLDIAAAVGGLGSTNKSIALFCNLSTTGNFSFDPAINYSTGTSGAFNITEGDLDGDGKPDIITANNASANLTIFRNQIGEPVITSFTPTSVVAGTSVIISGVNFTNVTAVSFGGVAATSFTVVSSSAIIATVGSGASGSISVTTSTGVGTLSGFTFLVPVPTISSFSPTSGVIGTTVTITGTNFSTTPANNIVYFGAVKATVSAATATSLTVTVPSGATYQPITVTTNNLTAFSTYPFIVTFSGGGSAFTSNTFGVKSAYSVSQSPKSICLQDIDGDNKPDMLAADNANSLLLISRNTSTGANNISFATNISQSTSSTPFGLCTADFDGDGKPDIAIGYSNNSANSTTGSIGVFKNNSSVGNISLSSEITYSTLGATTFVASGDFDGDGKPDLVIGYGYGIPYVSVFKNTSTVGKISFSSNRIDLSISSGANDDPLAVAIGDLDGDGKIDIACANLGSPNIAILRNTSSGIGNISFANQVGFAVGVTGCGPRCVSIGDLDGDGKPELVVGNAYATNVVILRNTCTVGSLSFIRNVIALSPSTQPTNIGIADLDGDGKLDITISNGPSVNNITAIRNTSTTGSITFDSPIYYSVNATGPYGIAVGDLDGDGKPEIVSGSTPVVILRNQIGEPVITSFTPSSASAGTSVIISGSNFTNVTAVSFGGVAATSFTVVSSSAIIATVGAGASGNVIVTTTTGSAFFAGFIYTSSTIAITSFSPTTASKGTTVTIKGTLFTGTTAVSFGGTPVSSFVVVDDNTITAVVANGASGIVSVTKNGVTVSLAGFIYTSCFPTVSTTNASICAGSSYIFNGNTYINAGTYVAHLTNSAGCDSAATLVLTLKSATTSTTNAGICAGSFYTFNGTTYNTAGTYTTHLTNAAGCDSIATLILFFKATSKSTTTASINAGDNYIFNGTTYTKAGTYLIHLVNAAGCDSAATLILTVNSSFTVGGSISNPLGIIIPNVNMTLSNGSITSTVNGKYSFNVNSGSSYSVKPSKNNDSVRINGVTVLDALLIQGHILGKFILNSPYKIIAADVDNSGDVSVLDIIYTKRLILGIDTTFKGKRLWAFVDSDYQFADPTNPFPYKDSIGFSNLASSKSAQSFIGVKLGDVNYDWDNTVMGANKTVTTPIELYYNNITIGNETEIRVPVRVKNFKNILGMQYTLNYNSKVLQLKSVENSSLNIEYGANHSNEGKVSFLWTDDKLIGHNMDDNSLLMDLVFTKTGTVVNEDISLSSDITPIEAWDASYLKHAIVKTTGKLAGATDYTISKDNWDVSPNPSTGIIKTNLSLVQGKDIQFELTAQDGKVVLTKKVVAAKGNSTNTFNLQQQTKLVPGIYYLKAIGVDGENVKRVVIR